MPKRTLLASRACTHTHTSLLQGLLSYTRTPLSELVSVRTGRVHLLERHRMLRMVQMSDSDDLPVVRLVLQVCVLSLSLSPTHSRALSHKGPYSSVRHCTTPNRPRVPRRSSTCCVLVCFIVADASQAVPQDKLWASHRPRCRGRGQCGVGRSAGPDHPATARARPR